MADVADAAAAGFSSYWIPNLDVQVDSLMALAIAGREVPGIELGSGIVPAAMGEQTLKVAGRHSDGTILWLTVRDPQDAVGARAGAPSRQQIECALARAEGGP